MKKTLRALISVLLVLMVVAPVFAEDNSKEVVVGQNSDETVVVKQEGDEAGGSVSDSSFTALETFTLNAYEVKDGVYTSTDKEVGSITVTLTLTQTVPEVASGSTREWIVFVTHDDDSRDKLTPTVSGTTVTFSCTRFSTFTLAYKDTKNADTSSNTNYSVVNTADKD